MNEATTHTAAALVDENLNVNSAANQVDDHLEDDDTTVLVVEDGLDLDLSLEDAVVTDAAESAAAANEAKEKAPLDIFNIIEDDQKALDGVPCQWEGPTVVKIARANNTRYLAELQRRYVPVRDIIDSRTPQAEAMSRKISRQAMAIAIVTGWENLMIDGRPLPYSRKAALFLLNNSEKFRRFVDQCSHDLNRYLKSVEFTQREEIKKLFAGTSTGAQN